MRRSWSAPTPAKAITGTVLHWGFADELSDSMCLVLKGDDGRTYRVNFGRGVGDRLHYRLGSEVRLREVGREIEVKEHSRGLELQLERTMPVRGAR